MRFTKMHGCGNDFIVVDWTDGAVGPLTITPDAARALCDRRTGIGADGILVIGPARGAGGRRWPLEIHNAEALAAAATAVAGPANVLAVRRSGEAELTLRVHERGVGETQACGTGSCAAVAAALGRGDVTGDTVQARLPGGTLEVRPRGPRYVLAGPAEYVFQGER